MHTQDLQHERKGELRGWSDWVEDAGVISGGVLERLQAILVTNRIRRFRVPTSCIEDIFAYEMTVLQLLEPGYIANAAPVVDKDERNLLLPRRPYNKIAPGHAPGRDRQLDLGVVVVRLIEFVVSVEVVQMMMQLGLAAYLRITQRVGAFDVENAHSRYTLGVCEEQSIGCATHDVVVEHPDARWLHHLAPHVVVRVDGHRLMVHSHSDCCDIVHIVWRVEISGKTSDVR